MLTWPWHLVAELWPTCLPSAPRLLRPHSPAAPLPCNNSCSVPVSPVAQCASPQVIYPLLASWTWTHSPSLLPHHFHAFIPAFHSLHNWWPGIQISAFWEDNKMTKSLCRRVCEVFATPCNHLDNILTIINFSLRYFSSLPWVFVVNRGNKEIIGVFMQF